MVRREVAKAVISRTLEVLADYTPRIGFLVFNS